MTRIASRLKVMILRASGERLIEMIPRRSRFARKLALDLRVGADPILAEDDAGLSGGRAPFVSIRGAAFIYSSL
jgi:hypothetical protein